MHQAHFLPKKSFLNEKNNFKNLHFFERTVEKIKDIVKYAVKPEYSDQPRNPLKMWLLLRSGRCSEVLLYKI